MDLAVYEPDLGEVSHRPANGLARLRFRHSNPSRMKDVCYILVCTRRHVVSLGCRQKIHTCV